MKKLLVTAFIVTLALLCAFSASAATYSGECGENGNNVTWALDTDSGVLTISGTGKMKDFSYSSPWEKFESYIKTATIGTGITGIGNYAFYSCDELTSISIPSSVTSIGDNAFRYCYKLTNLSIPDSVISIGDDAFYSCTNLKNTVGNLIYIKTTDNPYFYLLDTTDTYITACTIHENTKHIGDDAFYYCIYLPSLTIPAGVISIGDSAFYYCEELTSISIPDSVVSIGDDAFYGCTKLKNTVGNLIYIKTTGNPYFYLMDTTNTSITSCTINENTKFIGNKAFYYCNNLKNLSLPDSVIQIGSDAFYWCFALPDSLSYLKNDDYGFTRLYAADGRSKLFASNQVAAQLTVGWHANRSDVYTIMYAPDGRTRETLKKDVETYKKVGWYANKSDVYTIMYAPDGRTRETLKKDVEAYKKVGWYANKSDVYTTMYAPDGRTRETLKKDIEAYKKVGWYTAPVTILYAPDGRTRVTFKAEVEAYKKVGWYTEPVTLMYAADGRTRYTLNSQVEAYKKVGWYTNKSDVYTTMYAPDGRTRETLKKDVEAYKKVGWYANRSDIYTIMYAPDGRTRETLKIEVATYEKVGWYREPVTLMYAADGRTRYTLDSQVETYEKLGWYVDYYDAHTLMYALDGRSKYVPNANVNANKKVGWYLYEDYICALADQFVKEYGYNDAILFIEEEMDWEIDHYGHTDFSEKLEAKRESLFTKWKNSVGAPIAILGYYMGENSIGTPEVHIRVKNLTDKPIRAFKIKFTCYDAYGKKTSDYKNGSATITGEVADTYIGAYGSSTYTWTLYSNESTTEVKNIYPTQLAYTDKTTWYK